MSFEKEIHEYVCTHKTEIVDTLKELIRIPSVRGEAKEHAPFGNACAEALRYAESLYAQNGFDTALDADGGYLLSYYGNGNRSLGLFAHADVVAVKDDWIHTSPFTPVEKDGFLVGRGALDNKSAVVISLYCAKMLKELNIPFHSRLLIFTGCNEENGMHDVQNYLKKHNPPDFSLVCDSAFPLYRGNKGRILMKATKNTSFGEVNRFYGNGGGTNVATAVAFLAYSDALYQWLKEKENDRLSVCIEGNEIRITALGIGKHAALPEGSVNAAAIIADTLRQCKLLSNETQKTADFIYGACSDYYGGKVGVDCEDSEFGKLTFVNTQIDANETQTVLYFNIRRGVGIEEDELESRLNAAFAQNGFSIEFLSKSIPHALPQNHPMLSVLMNAYIAYTGETDAKMHVNAGGTYRQYLKNAAEIGPTLFWGAPDGTPQGHGNVHQPDECISIDGLLNALELTMLMLLECDKQEEV